MTFESWIPRVLVISLAAPLAACQVDEVEDEALAEDGEDGDFRLFCPVLPGSAPTADVSTSLAGVVQFITREGRGTGNGCDRFTVNVATPSGHRATEVTFESQFLSAYEGGEAVLGVWARSCGGELCTTWTSIPVTWELEESCEPGGITFCVSTLEGSASLPANNTYTEVRAGIRLEDSAGNSKDATITIFE